MLYLKVSNGVIVDIIPEENPAMPGVPLSQRFPAHYLAGLVAISEDSDVLLGWKLNTETGAFEPPILETLPEEPEPELPPSPTMRERLEAVEAENAKLKNSLSATVQSNAFLEECIVEMAQVIYG